MEVIELDSVGRPRAIIFNGVKFKRLSEKSKYFLSLYSTNEERKHAKSLHVVVYEFYSGERVQKGFHIHHKDGDVYNNDYSNLECLPASVHFRMPKKRDMEKVRANLERIRPLTKAWHSSPEGLAHHIENGS